MYDSKRAGSGKINPIALEGKTGVAVSHSVAMWLMNRTVSTVCLLSSTSGKNGNVKRAA